MKIPVVLLALCSVAFGRVGEKYEDFTKRIGHPAREESHKNGLIRASFREDGISVIVWVVKGTIAREVYSIVTKEQVEALMNKVAGKWKLINVSKEDGMQWASGHFSAQLVDEGILMISDGRAEPLIDEVEREKKAEQKAKSVKQVDKF